MHSCTEQILFQVAILEDRAQGEAITWEKIEKCLVGITHRKLRGAFGAKRQVNVIREDSLADVVCRFISKMGSRI